MKFHEETFVIDIGIICYHVVWYGQAGRKSATALFNKAGTGNNPNIDSVGFDISKVIRGFKCAFCPLC